MSDFEFFKSLNAQMAEQDKHKAKELVLGRIRERLAALRGDMEKGFCATVLDDRWSDHVTPEAFGYLTEEEAEALETLDGEQAVAEGSCVVLREFVLYLCECYEITPSEVAEARNEIWLRHD